MLSKFKEIGADLKNKALGLALFPVGFVLDLIADYFLRKMHIRREIANDVLISSEWTIIIPRTPMKIKKLVQEISFLLENCRDKSFRNKEYLIFSDGTVINPKREITVEIFDQYGNKYRLQSGSYGVYNYDSKSQTFAVRSAGFRRSYENRLPRDRTYTEVKIRSDKPFQVKKTFWHDFNMK